MMSSARALTLRLVGLIALAGGACGDSGSGADSAGPETGDTADPADTADAIDASDDDAADSTDATDTADSTDATDTADSTDATDTADSTDATDTADTTPDPAELAARTIAPTRLKATIDTLADDALAGRICGSEGHLVARDYVARELADAGLEPFGDDATFLAPYAARPFAGRFQLEPDGSIVPNATDTCWNLVGLYRGTDLADEYLVLVAHYDHLGISKDGEVYNGAFDDASGVAALLEIARALVREEVATRRSIVFLVSDQEEQGLVGAGEWLDAAPIPLTSIVAGIAADPLGRGLLPDYAPFVLSGAERSPDLSAFLRASSDLTDHPLAFIHRQMIPLFGSDHDAFYPHGLPAVWLVSPGMSFYHQPSDDAATIDYRVLRDVTRYFLRLAVRLANDDKRFGYVDDVPLDRVHAQDTRDVLVGVVGSQVIGDAERDTVRGWIADLDRVLASGWSAIDDPASFFLTALGYVAFALPSQFPGEIPPPFPAE